ncbi:von Willebrand factor D and EGF domain-containing protein-like [Pecten maximus]|uniref:von Willebrand factor D and EGF domain-containing protein-like n=1 Tax=Pecten maximus TaxID=6579 RepID=UPI0014585290|nr:von Willebrand factor D and EGF domain-containing protein-like [Pecten maximus]
MMDIDITPTLHEYKRITGLCGNLDGKSCNDCTSRGGQLCSEPPPNPGCTGGYNYFPEVFTESFRLTEEENLLNVDPDLHLLEPYPSSKKVCFCSKKDINQHGTEFASTVCSYRQYTSCGDGLTCILVGDHGSIVGPKRDIQQQTDFNEREERSAVVMTEVEATAACNLALMASPVYSVCTSIGISSPELQTCTADLMLTGDSNWTMYAVDRFQSACLDTIKKNSTLQEHFPDEINTIKNFTCPNSCSGKGSCSNGACTCDEGYASDDCSYDLSIPVSISGLGNDDLCDLQYGCDFIVIEGQQFPYGRNYTCQFIGQMTFVNSSVQMVDAQNVTAQYRSLFELLCDLPDVENIPGRLGVEYNVYVAMDSFDFSDAWNFVVIDTTCQTFTYEEGAVSFDIQEGYCFIEGVCILTGSYDQEDLCQECNSQKDVYTWTESKDCAVSDLRTAENNPQVTVIVAVTCSVAIVILFVGFGVYYWKVKSTNSVVKDISVGYSTKADAVENIHFNQPQNQKQNSSFSLKSNKTQPFPLTGKV